MIRALRCAQSECEKMIEATLAEWKKWFEQNRSDEYKIFGRKDEEFEDEEKFTRLWNVQDGKPPEGGEEFNSKAWRKRGKIPSPGLVLITTAGQSPLILTNESRRIKSQSTNRNKKNEKKGDAPTSRYLKKPYQWLCRDCGEIFSAKKSRIHCVRNPRQKATVSRQSTAWFEDYLENIKWTYKSPELLPLNLPGVIEDANALALAERAGKMLEEILADVEMTPPEYFALYNEKTRYLRVSDLKDKRKFARVIKNIAGWRKLKMRPLHKAPLGMIEIGHAFDEFLTDIFEKISSKSWGPGERVRFDCEELGVTVSGTPDLMFEGVPVETKTVRLFPHEVPEDKNQQSIFKYKWKNNYAKQAALYLQGVENDFMLLLIISRESGEFTLAPVDDSAMTEMQSDWVEWAEKFPEQLQEYRQLIAEENQARSGSDKSQSGEEE